MKEIYEEGLATGNPTFETESPSWEKWNSTHLEAGRLIAKEGNKIFGWAAISKVSDRCVYNGVAEVSVYVRSTARGKGIGSLLLNELIRHSEANNIWTLTAGIFPENKSSVRIHEKAGFRILGVRKKIGRMKGKWRDTLLLERRSEVVGVD